MQTDTRQRALFALVTEHIQALEQKAMFDLLPPEAQLDMVPQALTDGEESGSAGPLDMAAILRRARAKAGLDAHHDER
ncbi:MAG: hypothetical protein KDI16_14755 [Halioglobus sp.]|nr:hypothetical protein [Halioglobus sp.]